MKIPKERQDYLKSLTDTELQEDLAEVQAQPELFDDPKQTKREIVWEMARRNIISSVTPEIDSILNELQINIPGVSSTSNHVRPLPAPRQEMDPQTKKLIFIAIAVIVAIVLAKSKVIVK